MQDDPGQSIDIGWAAVERLPRVGLDAGWGTRQHPAGNGECSDGAAQNMESGELSPAR